MRDLYGELGIDPPDESKSQEFMGAPNGPSDEEQLAHIKKNPVGRMALWLTEHPYLQNFVRGVGNAAEPAVNALHSAINPVYETLEPTGIPAAAIGYTEGLANTGISAANLIPQLLGSESRIPHADITQHMRPTLANAVGGTLGKIGGQIHGAVKGENLLGKMLPDMQPGWGRIAKKIGQGSAAGYIFGETPEGERGLSTALGGIGGLFGSITKAGAGNTVRKDVEGLKKAYNIKYDDVLKVGEAEGLNKFIKAPLTSKRSLKGVNTAAKNAVSELVQHPTLTNAQNAQSKLGKFITKQESLLRTNQAIDQTALNNAIKVREGIQSNLKKALSKSNANLLDKYTEVQAGYGRELGPYLDNPAIMKSLSKWRHNDAYKYSPSWITKTLQGKGKSAELFKTGLAHKHPEVFLNKALGKTVLGAGGALGAKILADLIGKGVSNHLDFSQYTGE